MADDAPASDDDKPKSGLMGLIVPFVAGITFCGLGFGLFLFLGGMSNEADAKAPVPVEDVPPGFVAFGELVANIDDARLTRYLRLDVTLQVDGATVEETTAKVESQKAQLRSWALSYMSTLRMEDIRGAIGQNQIRREMQNKFNDILSPEGLDVVQDILFVEFTIQ